jgi:hypothetical protein
VLLLLLLILCRVKSTEIALEKAAAEVKGSVLASDAFFPFSWGDSVEMACKVNEPAPLMCGWVFNFGRTHVIVCVW